MLARAGGQRKVPVTRRGPPKLSAAFSAKLVQFVVVPEPRRTTATSPQLALITVKAFRRFCQDKFFAPPDPSPLPPPLLLALHGSWSQRFLVRPATRARRNGSGSMRALQKRSVLRLIQMYRSRHIYVR